MDPWWIVNIEMSEYVSEFLGEIIMIEIQLPS
jgi:hypothetical protein